MRKATRATIIEPIPFSESFRNLSLVPATASVPATVSALTPTTPPPTASAPVLSASPLTITAHAFTLQKSDAAPWENEDALACPGFTARCLETGPDNRPALRSRRVAMADGVSNAWRSGAWAKTLVWQFVRPDRAVFDDFAAWLDGVQAAWSRRPADLSRVPAFARPKAHRGAFATLLGLELTDGGNHPPAYRAIAVGDSCLLHVRNGTLLHGFPIASVNLFGSAPMTLPSNAQFAGNVIPHVCRMEEALMPGDRLLLATDALACHLLAGVATDPDWWRRMEPLLHDPNTLRNHVAAERSRHRIADDDTTALLLCIDA